MSGVSSVQESHVDRLSLAVGSVVMAGHLLALLSPTRRWGLSMLAYLPPIVTLAFAAISIGLLVAWIFFARNLSDAFRRIGDRLWACGNLEILLIYLVIASLFVAASMSHHLLGDGYLYLDELAYASRNDRVRTDNAPLLFLAISELYRLVSPLGVGALGTFRLFSWLCGISYTALVPLVARDLASSQSGRALLIGLLLTQGYVQLFFGYVETYPALLPLSLLYLWSGCRALDGGRLAWPLLIVAVLPACHLLTLALWPSFLYLAVRRAARRPGTGLFSTATALLATLGIACCVLWLLGGTPWRVVGPGTGGHLLPMHLGAPTVSAAYGILSLDHLLDVANVLLLAAPVPALLFPWLTGWPRTIEPRARFLWLASVATLAVICVSNPGIGAFRDWDLLSLPGLPLTLWVAVQLQHEDSGLSGRAAICLLAVGGLHAALWVALNTQNGATIQRFSELLRSAPLSHHARSYGAATLARYQRGLGRHAESFDSYALAVTALPDNGGYQRGAGFQAIEIGKLDEAERYFEEALQIDSSDAAAWEGIGIAHTGLGKQEEGLQAMQKAVVLDPHNSEFLVNLCRAHNLVAQYDRAIEACNRALVIDADDASAHHQLAVTFFALGDHPQSSFHLQRLRTLDPEGGQALEDLLNDR